VFFKIKSHNRHIKKTFVLNTLFCIFEKQTNTDMTAKEKEVKEPELPPSTIQQPPPRPQMTAEQIKMAKQYEAMFTGQFMQGRRRF